MRADVFFWAAVALLLFVAEVLAPGASDDFVPLLLLRTENALPPDAES